MDPKPQKPSFPFANPFSAWTELALKLWGFGKTAARPATSEKQVAVAVIPTADAEPARPAKARRTKGKARSKTKSKRVRR